MKSFKRSFRSLALATLLGLAVTARPQTSNIYTETFVQSPTQPSAILTSPYGLVYDLYRQREDGLLGHSDVLEVSGSGDDGFYFGNAALMNLYAPGPFMPSAPGNYVWNSYGNGETAYGAEPGWQLGIDFTNGPTPLFSAEFSTPPAGRNEPSSEIGVVGLLNGTVEWIEEAAIGPDSNVAIDGGPALINRIEIVRSQPITFTPSDEGDGAYALDSLTFLAFGPMGGYTWTPEPYAGSLPDPPSWATLGVGLAALATARRRKRLR